MDKENHQFDWDNSKILGQTKQRQAWEFLEAWYSMKKANNKHIEIDPIYTPRQGKTGTPELEYEVLFLQFEGGVIVTLEEVQDEHVTQGVGGGVKMVGKRKVLITVYRAQMFRESVTESALGLTDVEEATSEAT
eukprot:g46525.t1